MLTVAKLLQVIVHVLYIKFSVKLNSFMNNLNGNILSCLKFNILLVDGYFSDPENLAALTCEQAVNTDSSLLYRSRPRRAVHRPPWKKYWRADPGMPTVTSSHGPFRETALQAPLEARNLRQSPYICKFCLVIYINMSPLLVQKVYHSDLLNILYFPHYILNGHICWGFR